MELDDLKDSWKKETELFTQVNKKDIAQVQLILQEKTSGVLEKVRKKYKVIMTMAFVAIFANIMISPFLHWILGDDGPVFLELLATAGDQPGGLPGPGASWRRGFQFHRALASALRPSQWCERKARRGVPAYVVRRVAGGHQRDRADSVNHQWRASPDLDLQRDAHAVYPVPTALLEGSAGEAARLGHHPEYPGR